jgi:hypothetical protein
MKHLPIHARIRKGRPIIELNQANIVLRSNGW